MCTFGTDVRARNADFDVIPFNLHLVARAGSHAGTLVDHKVICEASQEENTYLFKIRNNYLSYSFLISYELQ